MTKNKKSQAVKNEETTGVAQALSKSEQFFNNNKKGLLIGLAAIVVVICLGFAYVKFIQEPKQEEAMAQLFPAESSFRSGLYELALNGDGNVLGFKDIIDQYGTKAGKAVYLYAGVSALQLGQYNEAIGFLNKYHTKDLILQARAYCNIGDAYVGLEDLNKGLSFYLKAAHLDANDYAAGYYKKAGILYEELGNPTAALEMYHTIKNEFPQSMEAYDIDKYISRLEFNK